MMQGSGNRVTVDFFTLDMVSTEGLRFSVVLQMTGSASAAFALTAQHCEASGDPCWKGQTQQSDQIRSDYISSSHTRLIRCLTLKGRVHSMQASIDEFGYTNQVILPHEFLHRFWPLKQMRTIFA